jgi:hypothetical protein
MSGLKGPPRWVGHRRRRDARPLPDDQVATRNTGPKVPPTNVALQPLEGSRPGIDRLGGGNYESHRRSIHDHGLAHVRDCGYRSTRSHRPGSRLTWQGGAFPAVPHPPFPAALSPTQLDHSTQRQSGSVHLSKQERETPRGATGEFWGPPPSGLLTSIWGFCSLSGS